MPVTQKGKGRAESAAAEHDTDAAVEAPASKWTFKVLADREASWTESRYWKDFAIGHSWIQLMGPDGSVSSWGYWPDLEGGYGIDPGAPHKSVPGRVRHPDTAHSPNAQAIYELEDAQAKKVSKAAMAKHSSPGMYNMFTYNCTTFAIEMAEAAGVAAPSGTLMGIANPNSFYKGIQSYNKKRGLDVMGADLGERKVETAEDNPAKP